MRPDNFIAPPIPWNEVDFADGSPVIGGMPYLIGFFDATTQPQEGAGRNPPAGKPWVTVVHQLPERANRWRKFYGTMIEALDDALLFGLLTTQAREEFATAPPLPPGYSQTFGGLMPDPALSLQTFEAMPGEPVDTWESLHRKIARAKMETTDTTPTRVM